MAAKKSIDKELVEENSILENNLEKIKKTISSKEFLKLKPAQQGNIKTQYEAMKIYHSTLKKRIKEVY